MPLKENAEATPLQCLQKARIHAARALEHIGDVSTPHKPLPSAQQVARACNDLAHAAAQIADALEKIDQQLGHIAAQLKPQPQATEGVSKS